MSLFRPRREDFIPKQALKITDKQSDAVAYVFTNRHGKPAARIFFGKQAKPVADYWFRDAAQRERCIIRHFEARREHAARRQKDRADCKAFQHDYKLGDILNTCWGYDQTNREFFEVVEVRGKHVILREIAQAREETGWLTGRCAPQSGQYIGEPIRRLAGKYGVRIDKVRSASKWNTGEVAGVKVGPALDWSAYH